MHVGVAWRALGENDEGWNAYRCLYAYLTPSGQEILYIGKSWGDTVRQRWNRSAKEGFWDDLERKRKIKNHIPLLGEIEVDFGSRFTQALLADIESLLIFHEKPWGNIQSQQSRISRPELSVRCRGDWPGRRHYLDR